jgi:hypothetical protein
MQMRAFSLLAFIGAASPGHAHANVTDPVRGFFQALDRQDFSRALALTDGAALSRTWNMVAQLRSEAAAHHARVEVKVKQLDVRAPGAAEPGRGVPVPVAFHIDVVGHKWLCHRVARQLEGEARFWVDPDRADRIVAIEGRLE